MRATKMLLILLMGLGLLGGCGLKGPLYLPDEKPASSTDKPAADATKDSEQDSKKDKNSNT